jgi:hypothetical protein
VAQSTSTSFFLSGLSQPNDQCAAPARKKEWKERGNYVQNQKLSKKTSEKRLLRSGKRIQSIQKNITKPS